MKKFKIFDKNHKRVNSGNARRAYKPRLAVFCLLFLISVFTAVFGFANFFVPFGTLDRYDETASAAISDDWLTFINEIGDNGTGTFTLSGDWKASSKSFGTNTAAYYKGAIVIKGGRDVTIDLAGHSINRAVGTTTQAYGAVIYVQNSTLTIIDSSAGKTGTITGGGSATATDDYSGSGIGLSNSTLYFEAGTVTGNITEKPNSGAISARKGSVLNMTGGAVTSNTGKSNYNSAIYVAADSVVNISGSVKITGNTMSGNYSAGGVLAYAAGAEANISGNVEISGNKATGTYSTGGVCANTNASVNIDGNVQILNNTVGNTGSAGGVLAYSAGTVTMTGGTISGNQATGTSKYMAGGAGAYTGNLILNDVTVTGNSTGAGTHCAGGIVSYGSAVVNGGSVTNNTYTGTIGAGGVTITGGYTFELNGGTVSGNGGVDAGGVYVWTDGKFNVGGAAKVENNILTSGSVTSNVIFYQTTGYMYVTENLVTGAHIGVTKLGNNYNYSLCRLTDGLSGTASDYFFADESPAYSVVNWDETGEAAIYCYNNQKNWQDCCIASTSATDKKTFILHSDWTAKTLGTESSYNDGALYVRSSKYIVLDLNGHKLSRGLTSKTATGYVIDVRGQLDIINSDPNNEGTITGGADSSYAGGIYLYGVSLDIGDGVNITGNLGVLGGGIYVRSGVVNLTGGTISGNTASSDGGGIYMSTGTVNVTGGTISGNTAKNGGGIFQLNGTLNITGGTMTGNNGSTLAGGVYVTSAKVINIGGSPYIYGNTHGTAKSNVYLAGNTSVINVTEPFVSGAKVGIERPLVGEFTTGWKDNMGSVSPDTVFESDSEEMYVLTYSTGEGAFLSTDNEANWVSAVTNSISEKNTHTVKLSKDWVATSGKFDTESNSKAFWNNGLYVPADASIILDLAGFKINRNTSSAMNSPIIRVNGTLEIIDSSAAQTGAITGSYSTYAATGTGATAALRAGGIAVSSGHLIMHAGTISNCKQSQSNAAGGVQVYAGTFDMYGGTITGCSRINEVAGAGGVVIMSKGTFNMYGGTICDNTSTYFTKTCAGGVYISDDSTFNIGGDVKIYDNTFSDNTGSDVFLASATGTMNVVDTLSSGARIGIRREVNNVTLPDGSQFTQDYSKYNSDDPSVHFFASEIGRHRVVEGDTDEGMLMCIDNGTNWSNVFNNGSGTVTLYSDWTATGSTKTFETTLTKGYYDGALQVKGDIVLDLNGYTINRGLTSAKASGYVIYLTSGSLTIIDSKETGNIGKITGGFGKDGTGGGIWLRAGTLSLLGGEITGNQDSVAGGVYVAKSAIINIGGEAAVYGNTAGGKASNIYCVDTYQMINVAEELTTLKKSGVYRDRNGEFTTGFADAMYGKNAADYFSCDDSELFFVFTSATGEAAFLTMDNASNWSDAVAASIKANGAAQTVSLCKNWTPASGNKFGDDGTKAFYEGAMQVPAGASIILDLNGYTVDRGLKGKNAITYGGLFYVRGELRIIDSRGGGIITGGNNSGTNGNAYACGAIGVFNGGILTLEAGTITGNTAATDATGAGAIAVYGTFNMEGGIITDNTGVRAGAVAVFGSYGEFYMSGGTISGNKSSLKTTSGTGGVHLSYVSYTYEGRTYYPLRLSGDPVIDGNTLSDGTKSNVYATTQTTRILIDGALSSGAKIGFTRTGAVDNYTLASNNFVTLGYGEYNSADPNDYFYSDSAKFRIEDYGSGNGREAQIYSLDNTMNWHFANAKDDVTFTLYSDWDAVTDSSTVTTLYNNEDVKATYFRNGALHVQSGKTITIDLNGFSINRALKSAASNGYVIYVDGKLVIEDSVGGGKITGGYNKENGGGVMLANGTLTMESGEISGNFAPDGAGVYVNTAANLYLGGTARIENNKKPTGVASNIYLADASGFLHIISRVEAGRVYGVTRLSNGDVTEGWADNNSASPLDFFVSEHVNYDTIEGATGELSFLSSYNDLNWQSAVTNSLANGGKTQTVKLSADWIPDGGSFGSGTGFYGGMLYVPSGASIVLDMNGWSINRALSKAQDSGGVFRILGELTIINGKDTGGVITGGKNTYSSAVRAGGIYVSAGGSLNATGITVTGNSESETKGAGGIYVADGGVVTLYNSKVTSNTSGSASTGTVYGGVYLENGSRFAVGGSTVIKDNTVKDGSKRDVTFAVNTMRLYVDSALTAGAEIGFYRTVNNYKNDGHNLVTSDYSRYNSEPAKTYFFASDNPAHDIVDENGEAALFCYDNAMNWLNAYNASLSGQVTFTLYSSWTANSANGFGTTAGYYNGALRIPSGGSIIIDLNGNTLDRNTSGTARTSGYVVYSQGRLVVTDGKGGGKITGGNNKTADEGSGIFVRASTTTLEAGTITGNKGIAGVYVHKSAYLELGGSANVTENFNGSTAANIYIQNTLSVVNIVSAFENGAKFGIARGANGVFTSGFGTYNADKNPADIFKSEDDRFYVTNNGETGDGLEGSFLSTDPSINWQFAVTQSLAKGGETEYFQLLTNWTADKGSFGTKTGYKGGAIYVPAGASVILDLNGHTIDKQGSTATTADCVIYVDGTLEIIDSSASGGGIITGGAYDGYNTYSYDRASCLNIRNGKVTMRGGKITGNKETANYGLKYGAAVYLHGGATFEMLGGEITGNQAYGAAGVYVSTGAYLNLGGSAKIYGNYSLSETGKKTEGVFGDVYLLNTEGIVNIVEPFTEGANIGMLADAKKIIASGTVFTSGWETYNPDKSPADVFFSDNEEDYLIIEVNTDDGIEGVIYCLDNSINWANAVSLSLSTKEEQTFRLYSNWTAETNSDYKTSFGTKTGYKSGGLFVPAGAKIILDLNGKTINRNMPNAQSYGFVIYVSGELTIIDSTIKNDTPLSSYGKITGGKIKDAGRRNGGGIHIESGSVTVLGGVITGNQTYVSAANQTDSKNDTYKYAGAGGVNVYGGVLNIGGYARIYENTDNNGNTSDIYIHNADAMINVVDTLNIDASVPQTGVMRGGIKAYKPTALGQLTSGWEEYNPNVDPADYFTADSQYIVITSMDFENGVEAIILSNDNLDNWVFAVNTSLNNGGMITRFSLSSNWTAASYTKYEKYYDTSFGQVANCFKDGALLVPAGANIVMDLKGYSIDRNHKEKYDEKYGAFNQVIYVEGCLQIVDSKGTSGTITGGSYGIHIAEDGFVCIGALPDTVDYMKGSGNKYVVRANTNGANVTGNSVYGVYGTADTLAVTGGKIYGNPVGAFMDKIEATDDGAAERDSTVMLGGSAYIYSSSANSDDLLLSSLFSKIEIISPFESGAKIGFRRDSLGQLTSGWGEHNDNAYNLDSGYFVSKGSDKYEIDTKWFDGKLEIVLNSYDNALNWEYAVQTSLETKEQQVFTMYGCWTAGANSLYTTAFGTSSAFLNGALYVPAGANILMDMNGHKLDRNLSDAVNNGCVIYVDGTLEVIDTIVPDPEGVTLPDCCNKPGGLITGGNNDSGSSAGAIHIGRGTFTLNGATIKGNTATSESASAGAIYVGGTFNLASGEISGNTGCKSGAILVASSGKFTMTDGTVTENIGTGASGGALYAMGTVDIEGGKILKNSGMIGGVYVANGGKVTLKNGEISDNEGGTAGGVYVTNSTTAYFNMEGGSITGNTGGLAGGVYSAGTARISGGLISENLAKGSDIDNGGGGVYVAGAANVTVNGGEITKNKGYNGVRVYSSGTLNLGGSAKIYENISTDPDFIAAEDTDGDGVAYCDVQLTAETRKITVSSAFTDEAHVGIYRIGAGVFTRNYGKYNEEHPDNYFFSNKHVYAIAMTEPAEDTFVEGVVGTPIDAPVGAEDLTYNGDWQTIITGYDEDKMQSETLPLNVQWGDGTDDNGLKYVQAVNAGTYIIAFKLGESYCWRDGSVAPKQIHVIINKATVEIIWTDESHTDDDGNTVKCVYDGVTNHTPFATVKSDDLFTNVIENKKDSCGVEWTGGTIYASKGLVEGQGHIATAIALDNPNYTISEESANHEFFVDRAPLPDGFGVATSEAHYKENTQLEAAGNVENGKLTFALEGSYENVTLTEDGLLLVSNADLVYKTISVMITVDDTDNYYGTSAVSTINVLPGKIYSSINETEVIYGETITLTLDLEGYDEVDLSKITYTVGNIGGVATVAEGNKLTGQKVGEVEITAFIQSHGPYLDSVIEGKITVLKRVMEVNWGELTATYDGNEHSPAVSAVTGTASDGKGVLEADAKNFNISAVKSGSTNPAVFVNAGKYGISVVIGNVNYELASEEEYHNSYEIYKANITPEFGPDRTAVYKTPFSPSVTGNLGGGAVTFTVDPAMLSGSGKTFTPIEVGKTQITADIAESANYNAGTVTAEFTVEKAEMPLELTSLTTVYGTDLALTASSGDDTADVRFAVADGFGDYAEISGNVLHPLKAGTVKVVLSADTTAHYLAASGVEGSVEITPREVEVSWSNLEFTYEKKAFLPTAEVVGGLLEGDTCTVVTITVQGYPAGAINAGGYTAVASGLSNANYTPKASTLTHQFTIKQAEATISWEEGATFTYNGKEQAPEATANVIEGDECKVNVLGTKNAATGLTAMALSLDNPNYKLAGNNLTCIYDILPFPTTVSWSNTVLVYDGTAQGPSASVNNLFAGDSCSVEIVGKQINVGHYTATAISLGNENYVLSPDVEHTGEFEITRAESGVTLLNPNATYGEIYQLSILNPERYGTVTYTLGAGAENVILSGDRLITMNVGTVTVTATVPATENYDEASDTKVITILPRPVSIRWENLTFEYDKASHVPSAYADNLVNSDSCVVTVDGAQINAGSYTASVSAISNNKYTLTGGTGRTQVYDITPVQITVEWGETELTYNGKEQYPEITIGNLLEGDACTATVVGAKDVGLNHIATLTAISNGNYTFERCDNKTVTFNINKLLAVIAWNDELTFEYDGREHCPSARVTNLQGDTCTVTVAGAATDVGEYTATAIALSNNNYTLEEAANLEVTFKIEPADRSFALASNRTVYGTELPLVLIGIEEDTGYSFSVTGATGSATVADDILTPTKAGLVYLTVSVDATENYNASTRTFEITIDKYAVEIDWEYPEFIYDNEEHSPTPVVSNVLENETCEILSVTGAVNAGVQTAEVTAISNDNYTLVGGKNVKTTFTIRPMPVEIKWSDVGPFVYDGSPKGPSAVVDGLILGDSCGVTISGKNTDAGTYTARAISLSNSNYTLTGASGVTTQYTIQRAKPVITIKTTDAILGINKLIEIDGNLGNGEVSFEIEAEGGLDALGNPVNGNTLAYMSGNYLVSQKVGTVVVRADVGETNNTESAYATGTIVIAKGKAPLSMERTNVTYGNVLPLIVFDDDGFLRDDSGNLIFGEVTFTVAPGEEDRAVIEEGNVLRPLKAGTVHVIMSTEETANFEATKVTVDISVARRTVTLSWSEDNSFEYNKTEQKPEAYVTNLVGSDVCTVEVTGATNAGDHTSKAVSLAGADAGNYTLTNAEDTELPFNIAPLPVDVNWGELTMQFNGANQRPAAWVVTIDDEPCTVTVIGAQKNVGVYEATATQLSNGNYVLTDKNLTIEYEITRAHITPVLSPSTAVYNREVTLTLSGNLENGAVTYTIISEESDGDGEITIDRFLPTKAGNVKIAFSVDPTENCYGYEGEAIIIVDKAERGEITLSTVQTVYGETLTLEITGNEPEPGAVSYAVAGASDDPVAVITDGNVLVAKHAGRAAVTVTVGASENYKEKVITGYVDIAQRIAEFSWIETEFLYKENTVQTPVAVVSNLLPGDECEVTVSGGQINAGSGLEAGVVSLSNPDYTHIGTVTANTVYEIGRVEIDITILNERITINKPEQLKISGNKGNATVTYEVTNGTGTAQIINADGAVSENGQYIKGTGLGTVIVKAFVPATQNYLGKETEMLVVIEKDRPTINLVNTTVTYGDELKLEISGNTENGAVTFSVANGTGSASLANREGGTYLRALKAGTVTVTVTVGETPSYKMSSTTHEVTINPRPIGGIEWSNFEFTYDGITVWAPTAKATGTLNNEPCGVIVGGGQIRAGRYTTAYAQALENTNYTLGSVDIHAPEFVVNKVKPVIKILTTSITIGVPTVLEISGNNDNATVRFVLENGSGTAELDGYVITGTQLGTVYLTVSVPETANYLYGSASGIITVEKPENPVELEQTEVYYGDSLTLSVIGAEEGGEVSVALKEDETLAELNDFVLTAKGAGEVTVIINVTETETYKATAKEITVTIKPRPIEVSWEYPEFTYNKTEHKPVATITNLVEGDECGFSVQGAVNAGTDCEAYVYDLLNENYTVEGGTTVTTNFTIKPRPVTLGWEEDCVFVYNGEVQTPKATVTDALEGDTVNVDKIDGFADVGDDLVATALSTDNPNYTVEGGTNLTTTYSIKPLEIDDPEEIIWGELTVVYNGKENAPEAYIIDKFSGEKVYLDVRGGGVHASDESYTAEIVGTLSYNYVLGESVLNDTSVTRREYRIIPATAVLKDEILVKEYNGKEQQPEFTVELLGEEDDLYISVTGGGTGIGRYPVSLALAGASVGDYVLAAEDADKIFEIIKKNLTLVIKSKDRTERYTGEAIDISDWTDWYELSLDGLLDADKDKTVEELFASNTLVIVPEIYTHLDGAALTEIVEEGGYYIVPTLTGGELTGAENYAVSSAVADESYGILTVGGKMYLELKEDTTYSYVYEKVSDFGFRYFRTYKEDGMKHGVDDVDFDRYVIGMVEAETNISYFLSNLSEDALSQIKLYNRDTLIFADGAPVEGFESVIESSILHIGTGWKIVYGDGDKADTVYVSVLGDVTGDGKISSEDLTELSSFIAGEKTQKLDFVEYRLSAMISNAGAIGGSDLSVLSAIIASNRQRTD